MAKKKTPWQRTFARFGVSQAELARLIGCDRSKVSRGLSDPEGFIMPHDQISLLKLAKKRGVDLPASDLLPGVK